MKNSSLFEGERSLREESEGRNTALIIQKKANSLKLVSVSNIVSVSYCIGHSVSISFQGILNI